MLLTLFLFFLSAAVIYVACEFFVNGVEWVGHRFQLGATATGTVLAASQLDDGRVLVQVVMNNDLEADSVLRVRDDNSSHLVIERLPYSLEDE